MLRSLKDWERFIFDGVDPQVIQRFCDRVLLSGDAVPRILDLIVLEHERVIRSEEHTSELQSLMRISYAVFCLKKTKMIQQQSCRQQKCKQNKAHKNIEQ